MCACRRKQDTEAEARYQATQHLLRVERLQRECFPSPVMLDWQFDRSTVSSAQQEACQAYVAHFPEAKEKNHGLLLWGDVGTGKSFQAGCIANALLEQEVSVRMTDLASVMNVGFEERNALLRSLGSCDLLILDDFGMERDSKFGLETVFQVIDRRVTAKKPLIVTTNLSLEQLKRPADLDHKRIYDRVLSVTVPVRFVGESLRAGEKQAGLNWMQGILG
jgi:DNA replication protein DnaC